MTADIQFINCRLFPVDVVSPVDPLLLLVLLTCPAPELGTTPSDKSSSLPLRPPPPPPRILICPLWCGLMETVEMEPGDGGLCSGGDVLWEGLPPWSASRLLEWSWVNSSWVEAGLLWFSSLCCTSYLDNGTWWEEWCGCCWWELLGLSITRVLKWSSRVGRGDDDEICSWTLELEPLLFAQKKAAFCRVQERMCGIIHCMRWKKRRYT